MPRPMGARRSVVRKMVLYRHCCPLFSPDLQSRKAGTSVVIEKGAWKCRMLTLIGTCDYKLMHILHFECFASRTGRILFRIVLFAGQKVHYDNTDEHVTKKVCVIHSRLVVSLVPLPGNLNLRT